MNVLDGFTQLLHEIRSGDGVNGHFLRAVLRVFSGKCAQHHLRMIDKVLIDVIAFRGCADADPARLFNRGAVALLEEQDVRHNARTGIALEGIARQPDCSDEVGASANVPAHAVRLLVHRAAGSDDGHHTARPDKIDGAGNEVIVNQEVIPVILTIRHLERAKGHIADDHIEKVIRKDSLFEALYSDGIALIELLGDSACDTVDFHAVHVRFVHRGREHTHEIANAA